MTRSQAAQFETKDPVGAGNYRESVKEFLSNYKDGESILKNAKHWDVAVPRTPKGEGRDDLPDTWLGVADRVISIIATEKYGLDYYPNTIEVITADQMLDAYSAVGMPVSYEHWSFGKQRLIEDQQYKQGKQGLAYEIVINTDPAIAYCMENNSPLMQILVIAHANYGHNSFFKGNGMFRQFTSAEDIIGDLRVMRDFIRDCEEQYGVERVEKLLDACHALQNYAVDRYRHPKPKEPQDIKALQKAKTEERFAAPNVSEAFDRVFRESLPDATKPSGKRDFAMAGNEENILKFMAKNAPHLEPWERKIMGMLCEKSQYFYPQRQTQVMNEGWASFWHYTLLHDMSDLDLLSDGQMLEFKDSHAGVLFQPEFDSPYWSGRFNPYTLGFAIFQDIKRVCENPTEEDKKWFPQHAGNGDWLATMKEAMQDFKDESFVLQFLSPQVMRDFDMFVFMDDEKDTHFSIPAIHDQDGFGMIREALASNYRLGDNEPTIEAWKYYNMTDRTLTLKHTMIDGKPLDKDDTEAVLKHMFQIWKHPVVIQTFDVNDKFISQIGIPPVPADKPRDLDMGPSL